MKDVRCVAHRGTPGGMIPENTRESAAVAVLSGADVVEVDVSVTVDGAVLAFHDGLERRLLGTDRNVTTMTRAEVEALPYLNGQIGGRRVLVQSLEYVVGSLGGMDVEVHIDRAWPWWDRVLPVLQGLGMDDQIVVKTPGSADHLRRLRSIPHPFRVAAICTLLTQVEHALDDEAVHIIELVASGPNAETLDPSLPARIRGTGRLTMVNAEVIGPPLWAAADDEVSLLDDPGRGWGVMLEAGFDYVQTDFPWLFTRYRDAHSTKGGAHG